MPKDDPEYYPFPAQSGVGGLADRGTNWMYGNVVEPLQRYFNPPQQQQAPPGYGALGELMRTDQPYGAMQQQGMQEATGISNRMRPEINQGRNAITDSIMRRQRR